MELGRFSWLSNGTYTYKQDEYSVFKAVCKHVDKLKPKEIVIKVENLAPPFETEPNANPNNDEIVDVLVIWIKSELHIYLFGWPTKLSEENVEKISTMLKEYVLARKPVESRSFYSYGRLFKDEIGRWEFNGFYKTDCVLENLDKDVVIRNIKFEWTCGNVNGDRFYWHKIGFDKSLMGISSPRKDYAFNPFKDNLKYSTRTMKAAQKVLDELAEENSLKWVKLSCNGLDKVEAKVLFNQERYMSIHYCYDPYCFLLREYNILLSDSQRNKMLKAINAIERDNRKNKILDFYYSFIPADNNPDKGFLVVQDDEGNIIEKDELYKHEEDGEWYDVKKKHPLHVPKGVTGDVWNAILKEIVSGELVDKATNNPNRRIRICVTVKEQE